MNKEESAIFKVESEEDEPFQSRTYAKKKQRKSEFVMRKRERREITENIAEVAPTGATGRIRLLGTEQTAFRALH